LKVKVSGNGIDFLVILIQFSLLYNECNVKYDFPCTSKSDDGFKSHFVYFARHRNETHS